MPDEPLRSQTAMLFGKGARNGPGTLLLYPDRLSHVGSSAMLGTAVAGGALGALVSGGVAKKRAAKEEATGGKEVTTIGLDRITEIHKARQGLNGNILGVVSTDGLTIKLGVRYDRWKPDLIAAFGAAGRQVHDGGAVVHLTPEGRLGGPTATGG